MNQLHKEKSPYLLQHQNNPVDWYPWSDEAFEKARKENKPVFLSIGYSTCHWCHVMAHESFEDESIAALLNEAFINVKVDREERPDIDAMYMTVCQMLNGHGGWPLTIILTPDKEPFFAATYIPKEARFGRIGLRQLIPGVSGMWQHEPAKVQKAVESIKGGFGRSQNFESGTFPGTEAIDFASEQLMSRYDPDFGGFGTAPKFPTPHNLMFLLRQWEHTGDERLLNSVTHTLTSMRLGGIWDHVGFGFHRYSTDREWLLPHFEKMLYDQALLMMIYTEAWQITKNALFKQTVYEISEYVTQNLTHDQGGFYCAEDADSDGEEGKFYVWETSEIDSILNKQECSFFRFSFNLKTEGNFEDEATKKRTGQNIPHLNTELEEEAAETWSLVRKKLFKEREKRTHPSLDDKILTDWNALMIVAFAKAGSAFGDISLTEKATNAYSFIQKHLLSGGILYHRFKDEETSIPAFADDHAFLIWAGIELYEATFRAGYLKDALDLNKYFLQHFWDSEQGGFYLSINDKDQPLGRQKQIYDGAVPSANSVAMMNLIRLARFTGESDLDDKANAIGCCFSSDLIRSGSSSTMSMMAIQFLNYDPKEIVISEGDNEADPYITILRSLFMPSKVLLFRPTEENNLIFELSGFIKDQRPVEHNTSIFICRNYSCEKPVFEMSQLIEALKLY